MRASLFLRFRAFSLCTSSVTHCRLKAASCLCWSISCSRYSSSRLCGVTHSNMCIHLTQVHGDTGGSISCSRYSTSRLCEVSHSSTCIHLTQVHGDTGGSISCSRYSSSRLCEVSHSSTCIHLTQVHSDTGGSISCSRYSSCWPPYPNNNNNKNNNPKTLKICFKRGVVTGEVFTGMIIFKGKGL